MKINGQSQRLLNHFQQGKSIDRLQAIIELGIIELSARLTQLEREGHRFSKVRKTVTNRYGEKASVVEYSLIN